MKLRSILLLGLLAACGGDATGAAGNDELSAGERAAIARSMMTLGNGAAATGASRDVLPGDGPSHDTNISFSYAATHGCQPSGSVGLSGTVSASYVDATQAGSVNASLTVTHAACAHPTENGAPVVVTGDPNIVLTLQATSAARQVTGLTIRETGAFTWTRGEGNSGRCTIDLTGTRNQATGKIEYSGTFCGHQVQGVTD